MLYGDMKGVTKMHRTASLSILGLYNYNESIFENLKVPEAKTYEDYNAVTEAVDKQALIDNILAECAGLELVYPNFDIMKRLIGVWSTKHEREWEKLNLTIYIEYNPIHNYNRFEEWEDNEDLDRTQTSEASGTINNTSTSKTAGFNSTQLVENGGGTDSGTSTQNNESSLEDKKKGTHSGHMYGNIGVTTSDRLLREYRENAKTNLYDHITRQFKEEFCLMIY